jgi:hypothetical protein
MRNVVLAIANSVSDVLSETEQLCQTKRLRPVSCRLLEMFYVLGWDDGFVEYNRPSLASALKERTQSIDVALAELQDLRLIDARRGQKHEVAELIALSAPRDSAHPHLGWWQMYSIEIFDESE